jgi:hypothetical protein
MEDATPVDGETPMEDASPVDEATSMDDATPMDDSISAPTADRKFSAYPVRSAVSWR